MTDKERAKVAKLHAIWVKVDKGGRQAQIYSRGEWHNMSDSDHASFINFLYRSKPENIQPKEGCRMLDPNVKKKVGDWARDSDSEIWLPVTYDGPQHKNVFYCRPTEPEIRPWKIHEVPVGAVVRSKERPRYKTTITGITLTDDVYSVHLDGVYTTLVNMYNNFEWCWPTDQFADKWQPCGVEVKDDA